MHATTSLARPSALPIRLLVTLALLASLATVAPVEAKGPPEPIRFAKKL